MFKFKSSNPYWAEFSKYQTFESVDDMIYILDRFTSTYDLTSAAKAVLNTLKLHSKRFIGVCWLYQEEIARKAGVSVSSVKRTLKALKETGILTIHHCIHTKRGGQTHSVYVINTDFIGNDIPEDLPNELPSEPVKEPSKPCVAQDTDVQPETHKNSHKNSNTSLNHLSISKSEKLKFIPNEFIDLMEQFYANNPEIILARWKTVCVAAKRSGLSSKTAKLDLIKQAWKDVVNFYKRGKIKNSTDDGIGGYFYSVLCDYLLDDYLRSLAM